MISGTPLTAEMMADAFGCFWNAALAHRYGTVEARVAEGVQAISMRLQELANEAQRKRMKILFGCLHTDENSSTYITFSDGQWVLATMTKVMGGVSYEEICRHGDWFEFVELCAEYSDYVEEKND